MIYFMDYNEKYTCIFMLSIHLYKGAKMKSLDYQKMELVIGGLKECKRGLYKSSSALIRCIFMVAKNKRKTKHQLVY